MSAANEEIPGSSGTTQRELGGGVERNGGGLGNQDPESARAIFRFESIAIVSVRITRAMLKENLNRRFESFDLNSTISRAMSQFRG
jgi:hypothetical protein